MSVTTIGFAVSLVALALIVLIHEQEIKRIKRQATTQEKMIISVADQVRSNGNPDLH